MTFSDFIIPILFFLMIYMVVIMCYAPMKNHLRYKKRTTILTISVVCALLSIATFISTIFFSEDFGIVNVIGIIILFLTYHRTLTLHISQTATLFLLVCAFISFLANFAIIFDALNHPDGELVDFSFHALYFLMLLLVLFCVLSAFPLSKYGSYIFDNVHQSRVWWLAALVAAIFYGFNLSMVIHHYSTLHTNKVGVAYITVMIVMFVLLILLCIIFYLIVDTLVQKSETDDKNRILEMQEKQYQSLQRYLNADAKVRHDFRQTIYALTELSSRKDYQALDEYLRRYRDQLPMKDSIDYCADPALNALLNHYNSKVEAEGIRSEFNVSLPKILYVDSIDFCSIVGNVLENAVIACLDVPAGKRFIRLVISGEQNSEIYIALSNSFDGNVRQVKDRYLSTHKGGSGIGLISVAATAAEYGGTADFSHDDEVFYSNIMFLNRATQ